MAAGSIASGAVTIVANADQLATGLAHAQNRVSKFGDDTTKKLASSGKSGGREFAKNLGADFAQEIGRRSFVGGILGGLAGGGLAGGASELIANTFGLLVDQASDWASGLSAAKEQLAQTTVHLATIEKSIERTTKLSTEWRGAMASTADVVASLDQDMAMLRESIQAMAGDWKNAKARIDEVNEPSFSQFGRVLLFRQEDVFKEATKNANTQADAITKLAAKYRELEQQKERALDPRQDPVKMGQLTKSFQEMSDALVKLRMNEIDQKLFDLEKLGANPAELKNAADMLVRLRDEKAKIAEQEEMMKQAAKLPPPWLGAALGFAGDIAKAFEGIESTGTKFAGAMESGSREAYSLVIRDQFGERSGMEGDKTTSAVKQLKAPLERAAERLDQINNKLGDIEQV